MFERAAILFVPFLAFLAEHAFLRSLVMTTLMGLGVYLLCALVGITAEMSQRHDMSVYRTRNSLNDLAYVVFYQCSIYSLLARDDSLL